MANTVQALSSFLGIGGNKISHREKIISGLGGFTGILLILLVSQKFVAGTESSLVVASMGASAVLVFAVPHGPLSQPWALAGGHLVSALIGVSCYYAIPDGLLAAAAAVGLAIVAMYYLRCIHPPGGATALTAVVASSVHPLGYTFVVTPVFINLVVIFAVAVVFNYLFPWRRYPAAMMQYGRNTHDVSQQQSQAKLNHEDIEHALQHMNQFMDISAADLNRIFQLAQSRNHTCLPLDQIRLGHYYSNGEYGHNWSVRRVVDESDNPRPDRDLIIYKVVAGQGRRDSGMVTRNEFAKWARYEVFLNENSWQRVAQFNNLGRAVS